MAVGVLVEGPEYADLLLHIGQLLPLRLHARHVLPGLLRVLALRLLQLNNRPSQEVVVSSVVIDAGLDLVEAAPQSTESGKSNVLWRCASALELVRDGGVLAENVTVANAEDPGSRVAAPVVVLVEEQRDTTLSIGGLPLRSSDRHAERSSEEATDIVGGVGVVGDVQKGWTRQLLYGSLVPFD